MDRIFRNAFIGGVALLATAIANVPAASASLLFEFDVGFTAGPLDGERLTGSFEIDDSTLDRTGIEIFTPNGSIDDDTLLALNISIDGLSYSVADDIGLGPFPRVLSSNGIFGGIDFQADINGNTLLFDGSSVTFDPIGPNNTSSGFVIDVRQTAVPVPATIALLGAGLIALGVTAHRLRQA